MLQHIHTHGIRQPLRPIFQDLVRQQKANVIKRARWLFGKLHITAHALSERDAE